MTQVLEHKESYSILIIDSDKRSRSFLVRSIQKKLNASVIVSNNVLEAIDEIRNKNFDFIFIDSKGSVVEPQDSIVQIQKHAFFATKFFVLVTKEIEVERTVHLLQKGFHGFISKPFHVDSIVQKLKLIEKQNASKSFVQSDATQSILLADGNERYRSNLRGLLEQQYLIHEAVTGYDALVLHELYTPLKIILSSSIDVIPFETVIKKIRSMRSNETVDIYVTLFDSSQEMSERIISLGATSTLKRTIDVKSSIESLISAGILPATTS